MKKKLITAAVGAAIVAVAGIAQADVKVSGYGNLSLDQIKGCKYQSGCVYNSDPAAQNTNALNVSSNSSYIKFDASEDLGGGLAAVFSWTEYLRIDNNSSGAQVSGGNTYGGLATPAGVIVLGSHDTGAKLAGRTVDLFGNQVGDSRNADIANNRAPNVVAYLSPNFSGFSFVLGHSTNTGTTSPTNNVGGAGIGTATDTNAADKNSIQADTLLLSYANGPLTVVVGYDKAKLGDNLALSSGVAGMAASHSFPGSTFKAPKWTTVGAKYSFPTATDVVAVYQKHENVGLGVDDALLATLLAAPYSANNTNPVAVDSIKTMGIGVKQSFGGNNAVKVQYYEMKLDPIISGIDCQKPKMLAVGFDHDFSKTTTGYVAYAEMKNSQNGDKTSAVKTCNSAYTATGGGHGDSSGTAPGEKSSAISVGMIFKF